MLIDVKIGLDGESNGVCLNGRGKVVMFLLGNGVVVLWTGSVMGYG